MSFLENNTEPCIKQSTRCFIWTGGKVCSIEICKGDSLETVIKKLGKSIFHLEKEIDIQDLDYSFLYSEKECPPKNLKDLLQLILNKIESCCSDENVESESQILSVIPASCFQNALGEEAISIVTYVEYLGETLCGQKQEIENLKEGLAQMRNQVDDLSEQVLTLIGGLYGK